MLHCKQWLYMIHHRFAPFHELFKEPSYENQMTASSTAQISLLHPSGKICQNFRISKLKLKNKPVQFNRLKTTVPKMCSRDQHCDVAGSIQCWRSFSNPSYSASNPTFSDSPRKMVSDGLSFWVPATHVGDPGGVPGSGFSLSRFRHCGHLGGESGDKVLAHSLCLSLFPCHLRRR